MKITPENLKETTQPKISFTNLIENCQANISFLTHYMLSVNYLMESPLISQRIYLEKVFSNFLLSSIFFHSNCSSTLARVIHSMNSTKIDQPKFLLKKSFKHHTQISQTENSTNCLNKTFHIDLIQKDQSSISSKNLM